MAYTVTEFFSRYLSAELAVFLISMLPVLELRGGLAAAAVLGLPWQSASIICLLGTCLPVPFILLFIQKILRWMTTVRGLRKIASRFIEKANKKGEEMRRKHPARLKWALYIFVAIPFVPGTGAWTGSLIASFLGLPIHMSMPPIVLGSATAGVIMLAVAYGLPALL